LGTATAWVGVLIAGWRDADQVPEDVEPMMEMVANLCHGAIQLGVQHAAAADLGKLASQLEAEIRDQTAALTVGLLALDHELRVIRANPMAARLLGYKEGELHGLQVQDVLVGPEDILASLLDALGHDRESERTRLTIHRRDGTPFPIHLRAVPLSKDARSRLLVILTDQSEQQAIEDQTENLAQRALLGEVTAIFAHEVRNPINNISTGVQLVASRLGNQHPLYDSLDRVRKECLRLDQLMSDVLFFARPLELRMEPLDLVDMIRHLLSRWKPRLKQAGVQCHTSFDSNTPVVRADPRTLEQVVVNLITNALQAMPDGGTLSVSLAPSRDAQGEVAELKIADTGPGIPEDVATRIFDPFFTTKKDGTGLGLAISRRILMAHKGGIQVESYPDAGTVFTIRVPAVQESNEVAADERNRSRR
jgi:PAS domain S-box-containing protein